MKYLIAIAGVGVVLYLILKQFQDTSTPLGQAAQAVTNAVTTASTAGYNAVTGGLSPGQITDATQSEAAGIVAASGGTISSDQALKMAQQDQGALAAAPGGPTYWDGVKAAFSNIF